MSWKKHFTLVKNNSPLTNVSGGGSSDGTKYSHYASHLPEVYVGHPNRIERYSDLPGKVIGILEGARYFTRFDNDQALHKESAAHYENLMMMLQRGRVDVVVAPELVGLYTLRAQGIEANISPFFVPGDRSWIAVSNQSPARRYAEDIRAALKLIEREGIREDLVLKYQEQKAY